MVANVVKVKCMVCLKDEEGSKEGLSWIGCDDPCGRWYHHSCVGMDEVDIGSLSEEQWFSSHVLGVLLSECGKGRNL